jgi:hypothetical protein
MSTIEELKKAALDYHRKAPAGKIKVSSTKSVVTQRELSLAYSPGVAAACEEIVRDPREVATLTARLDSAPGNYRIDAYFSNHCGSAGRGHADAYLGGTTADNLQVFDFVVTLPNVLATGVVSLTATDHEGNTSEMGVCFPVVGGDTVFRNGFDE